MDDAVAVAAERAAAFARGLGMEPAAAPFRIAGIGRAGHALRCIASAIGRLPRPPAN